MARNSVQFQKGLSEAEFEQHYGTEAACREALFRWRWPEGFECPICGERRHSEVRSRQLFQCSACRRQTSLTAGTIFAATISPGHGLDKGAKSGPGLNGLLARGQHETRPGRAGH